MLSARSGSLALKLPLESEYTSFSTVDECVRSPRTPTYLPQSPDRHPPYDHTKALEENSPTRSESRVELPPTPDQPLAWIWICHLCHSRYPLGVTRRCLVDGHYYCSGEANQPNLRKKKKRQSCSSEFDYVAWREWGDWKRKALKLLKNPRRAAGCETCVFPSQCRYPAEKEDVGLQNPAKTRSGTTTGRITPKIEVDTRESKTNVDTDNGDTQMSPSSPSTSASTSNENVSFEQILGNIFTGDKSMKVDSSKKDGSNKKGQGKRKNSPQKGYVSAIEREMEREAEHVKQLVGVDLWNNLEDIDLGNLKAKVD